MMELQTLPRALRGFEVEDWLTTKEDGHKGFVFYLLLSQRTTPGIVADNLGRELKVRPAKGRSTIGIRYTNHEGIKVNITLGFGSARRETVEGAMFLEKSSRCKAMVSFRDPSSSL